MDHEFYEYPSRVTLVVELVIYESDNLQKEYCNSAANISIYEIVIESSH